MSGHKLDLRKATIARLAQLYPACLYAARQQQRPLKIGIRRELATLDLGIGRREIDSALAWYVNGICYLQSLRVGADRIGLDSRRRQRGGRSSCAREARGTGPAVR